MKDLSNTLKRSKTHKYHWSARESGHRLYFCSSRPNLNNSRGVKKERGKAITLLDRNTSTFAYRDLPNGRYYEYYIQTACLENKQVKSISYYYASGEGSGVGVDLLEDLEGRLIMPTNYYFDVKGGKVSEHTKKQKPSNKPINEFSLIDLCSKVKGVQGDSWSKVKEATLNAPSSIRSANNQIMKFYAKKFHDGKISKRLFSYCIGIRKRCDHQPRHFPFKLKDKLCDVYSLYEESRPFPPPEVKVKRAEGIALRLISDWHSQHDFALDLDPINKHLNNKHK